MGAHILQPTFTGGELSPSLYARVDLARYGTSVKTAKNFIVRPYGGLVNRPGFQFIGEVKNSANATRLIPFVFSSEVAYVIELGHLYARFIYRGGYVTHEGDVVEIATPWPSNVLDDLAFTQSADVLYVVHQDYKPREIRRTGASEFQIREFQAKNGPFGTINSNEAIKIASSRATGQTTLTANADVFTADMVGTMVYLEEKDLRNVRPWEPGWRGVTNGTLARSDGKTYRATNVPAAPPDGWVQTGTIRPTHDSGIESDGPGDSRAAAVVTDGSEVPHYISGIKWEYLHSGYGIVQITGYTNAREVTGVVMSRVPDSVVGGMGTPGNTWDFTGDGSTVTFPITGRSSTSEGSYTVTIDGVPVQSNPYYTPPPGSGGGSKPGDGRNDELYDRVLE